ncbi:hypothetical protein [Paenibacillus lautus]|uniref:hypothetical protein n=1 Tax=Paenibacillus lautus TaxID=1401 RepID=UPI001C0F8665|nr:hypothetical protein [Paenibacillus lautus]MBU5347587.1 hypothetical protein [Paenibacillus lautus]
MNSSRYTSGGDGIVAGEAKRSPLNPGNHPWANSSFLDLTAIGRTIRHRSGLSCTKLLYQPASFFKVNLNLRPTGI